MWTVRKPHIWIPPVYMYMQLICIYICMYVYMYTYMYMYMRM